MRLAHHGASHRDPLPLAAGQLLRLAIEQGLEAEHAGCPRDAARDLRLRDFPQPEAEREVLAHGEMRIERVVLKHHRDVALARREVRDVAVVDADGARGHRLEARDHAQDRRLAGARSADEHEQLAVGDVEVELLDDASRRRSACVTCSKETDGIYPFTPAPAMLSMK